MPCVQPIFANSLDVSHQVLYLVHLTSSNTSATTGSTPLDVVLRLAFERNAGVRMDLAVVCGLVHTDATFSYSVKRETWPSEHIHGLQYLSYHWFCLHNSCEWLGGHGWPKTKQLYSQCQVHTKPHHRDVPAAQPPCHQRDPFEFTRHVTFNSFAEPALRLWQNEFTKSWACIWETPTSRWQT